MRRTGSAPLDPGPLRPLGEGKNYWEASGPVHHPGPDALDPSRRVTMVIEKFPRPREHRVGVGFDSFESIAIVGMVRGFAAIAHENERAGAHRARIGAVTGNGLVTRQRRPVELNLLCEILRPIAAEPTGRMIAAPGTFVSSMCHRAELPSIPVSVTT